MKNISKIVLYAPLVFLILFNMGFVLSGLKGPGAAFFWHYKRIIRDYFIGLPLFIFLGVIFLVLLYYVVLERDIFQFFKVSFCIFLLFIIAFNISLFPTLNKTPHESLNSYFTLKKSASLNEAANKSWGKRGLFINQYLIMDSFLKDKDLVIPSLREMEKDDYLRAFVRPRQMIEKHYNRLLSKQDMKELNKLEIQSFPDFFTLKRLQKFVLIDVSKGLDTYYFFFFDGVYVFVPEDIALQILLKTHD